MELRPLPASSVANPFSRRLGDLILSVATSGFDNDLFGIAREATGCAHLTAFSTDVDAGQQMIFAANVGEAPFARETGEAYVTRFWEADPVNRACSGIREEDGVVFARLSVEDLRASTFRRECHSLNGWIYSGARMVDRISIFRRRGDRTVKISFHRDESVGPFGDREIDNIAAASEMLSALLIRHTPPKAPSAAEAAVAERSSYRMALASVGPLLTAREAEVCACIVHGMSSEGIALELGISVNTVRTFRKRAYSRLNICSQNELMKVVLAGLAKAHPMPVAAPSKAPAR